MSDEHGVAHHGPPILTEREAGICRAMVEWIKTARKQYGDDWLPTWVDIEKSRLFWRLRSGKEPFTSPPPRAYSCPWYEVIEEDRPHWCYELWVGNGDFFPSTNCYIAQCAYEILNRDDDGIPSLVRFAPWEFRVWRGPSPDGVNGWWIQRLFSPTAAPDPSLHDATVDRNDASPNELKSSAHEPEK